MLAGQNLITRFLAAACAAALLIGCSGKSEGDGGNKGGSAGTAGGAAGTAGAGQGGSASAGAGAVAGRAGTSGSGGTAGGSGGSSGAGSGSGGTAGGSGGSEKGGASGRAGGRGGSTGGAGASGAGGGGSDAGAAGESGTYCGGMEGISCPTFEYCDFGGLCTLADAAGVCREQGLETCSADRVCGCDGKVYANDCRAHSAGVDTTESDLCTKFSSGDEGQACVSDDDCTGDLKCCSSPIGVVSCTTPMGNGCPLTP